MLETLKSLLYRFCLIFIIGFLVTLPDNYFLFPNLGELTRPFVEGLCQMVRFHEDSLLYSDSEIMLTWTVLLGVFSLVSALIWTFIRKDISPFLYFWLSQISCYYLSFCMFVYGLNKVFKLQFFFPEPNTLFTPLGQLSPDILFWSSIGTSYSYNIFAGIMEVIPAILLLFRKTRLLGALIALGVLINVLMINFGFGISVKIYSLFLILLCLILIQPYSLRLYSFFIKSAVVSPPEIKTPFQQENRNRLRLFLKLAVVLIILTESIVPLLISGVFNGDLKRENGNRAAYIVKENDMHVKHVFFHSQEYFIIQLEDDSFTDYKSMLAGDQLLLTDDHKRRCTLLFNKTEEREAEISGSLFGIDIHWKLYEIDLRKMPIYELQSSVDNH